MFKIVIYVLINDCDSSGLNGNGSLSSPVHGVDEDVDDMGTPPPMPPLPPHMLPLFPPPPPGAPLPPGMMPPPLPPGMPPFMGPLPPLPDRRLPPAGRMASPPYRWQRSPPGGDRRSHSPGSDYSDHHRYSPDRRSDRSRRSPGPHGRSPPPRNHSPPPQDRWYNRSPDPYARSRASPRHLYDDPGYHQDTNSHSIMHPVRGW